MYVSVAVNSACDHSITAILYVLPYITIPILLLFPIPFPTHLITLFTYM